MWVEDPGYYQWKEIKGIGYWWLSVPIDAYQEQVPFPVYF